MNKIRKAVIVGASSGMGKELALRLAHAGTALGLVARREERLQQIKSELTAHEFTASVIVKSFDIADTPHAIPAMEQLLAEMGQVDLILLCAGTGYVDESLSWEPQRQTVATNVAGFAAMATVAMRHFLRQKKGHLAGVSSVAAIRGARKSPAYNASKAFVSNYLEGLRQMAINSGYPITVTEIIPGFVDTPMAKGDGLFWVAPASKAAVQIIHAIHKKKLCVYVTKRWRIVVWLLRLLPSAMYNRI